MKRLLLSSALCLLLVPSIAGAQSMFDMFFSEAANLRTGSDMGTYVDDFIIEEMKKWQGVGIILTPADIALAAKGSEEVCQNKTMLDGKPLIFTVGGLMNTGECNGLIAAIQSLLNAEREARDLGDDLIEATNGAELSIADEPHRPVNMAIFSFLIKHVWSGTGGSIVPWSGDADDAVTELENVLTTQTPDERDLAVVRFHYGYYRDNREADPRLQSAATDQVGAALQRIADILKIKKGDLKNVAAFATPKLKVSNIAFWARSDDLGLQWVYPSHIVRQKIVPAGTYPVIVAGVQGERLAYPFEYRGTARISDPKITTPLCTRPVAQFGYLCREVPSLSATCESTKPDTIALVTCSNDTVQAEGGAPFCKELDLLYEDTGLPLEDPDRPGHINPALVKANPKTTCSPDYKVVYLDDISSHACYIGMCLAQSMSGHSLVPNRNPVVTNEATSPYQSCMRADPELGLYSEAAKGSPFPLPTYLGHMLVQDFEQAYCLKNGDTSRSVLGDCSYHANQDIATPQYEQLPAMTKVVENGLAVAKDQDAFLSLAAAIGQRVSLDQTILMESKLYAAHAQSIHQMAKLFLELKRAPVTQTTCPWTGPFTKYGT